MSEKFVADCTGCSEALPGQRIQLLWSGYGEIRRMTLHGRLDGQTEPSSVVLKKVSPPNDDSSRSHDRKLRSYDIECNFYRVYSNRLGDGEFYLFVASLWCMYICVYWEKNKVYVNSMQSATPVGL
jgi:hypothetical protein